jgi:hypothetical protein
MKKDLIDRMLALPFCFGKISSPNPFLAKIKNGRSSVFLRLCPTRKERGKI